jgi:hypothetical protein
MHAFGTSQEAHSFFKNPELLQAMQEAGVEKTSQRTKFYDEA